MQYIDSFPWPVREIENFWITLKDGTRLAARMWIPETAESHPVPAILEYIPYRKNDFTAKRDALHHHYFAGHGYACLRVDIRGSGDSDGVLPDEYLEQELADCEEVLSWIASQPWCDGKIGIMGISWGGFNGLQLAARQHPAIKAVLTACSTDDRYADDVHYMGGCLLGDNLSWSSTMLAFNSLPPDPRHVGERWREMWIDRLENSGIWIEKWLRHQRRDDYWKHGSICEKFSAVKVPVFAVSGWADGYTNSVFRLLENLTVPRMGLVGPWSHKYPHIGIPGPAIGFLQEAVRWWDQWLKGKETGIMEEPMLRAWMQDSVPPTTYYRMRPGRWVGEESWPSPRIEYRKLLLGLRRLRSDKEKVREVAYAVESPLSVGFFAGKWCSFSATPDLPHDQREEDGGALWFDSNVLQKPTEILGAPTAELELESNKPAAIVCLRLSDISPDQRATRVTYGMLNLAHRDSHEYPSPLEPGRRYRVRVQLNDIAHVFPAGHRIRLAISTSYWPLAWPAPEPARLAIYSAKSSLTIPVRPGRKEDSQMTPFGEPEAAPPPKTTLIEPQDYEWNVIRDLAKNISTLEVKKDEGIYRLEDIDLEVENHTTEWYTYRGADYSSVRGETNAVRGLRRGDWHAKGITRTVLTSDSQNFRVRSDIDAWEGDTRIYCRSEDHLIPRDFM